MMKMTTTNRTISRRVSGAWLVAGIVCVVSCAEVSLRSSVKNGRLAETKKYIEKDHMSPEMPNACGWTLLHFAAYYESAPLVEYLISRSVKVDAKTLTHSGQCIPYSKIPAGSTPLCIAAYYGQADIIDILLKHGAKPGLKNSEGYSALDYAKKFEFALSFKALETAADKAASASGDGAE